MTRPLKWVLPEEWIRYFESVARRRFDEFQARYSGTPLLMNRNHHSSVEIPFITNSLSVGRVTEE